MPPNPHRPASPKLLADITRVGYIPRVWLAPQYIRDLRELVRHRHGLVGQCTQVKLRLRAVLRNHRIVCPYSPWTINGKKWLLNKENITSPALLFLLQEHYETIEYLNKKIANATERMATHVVDNLTSFTVSNLSIIVVLSPNEVKNSATIF